MDTTAEKLSSGIQERSRMRPTIPVTWKRAIQKHILGRNYVQSLHSSRPADTPSSHKTEEIATTSYNRSNSALSTDNTRSSGQSHQSLAGTWLESQINQVSSFYEAQSSRSGTMESNSVQNNLFSSKKHIKLAHLNEHNIHIINYEDNPFIVSTELSLLLWDMDVDISDTMLKLKRISVSCTSIKKSREPQLFTEMNESGMFQNSWLSEEAVILYPLGCIPSLIDVFSHPSSTLRSEVEREMVAFQEWAGNSEQLLAAAKKSPPLARISSRTEEEIQLAIKAMELEIELIEDMKKQFDIQQAKELITMEQQIIALNAIIGEKRNSKRK